jgi:hypothetical protein
LELAMSALAGYLEAIGVEEVVAEFSVGDRIRL